MGIFYVHKNVCTWIPHFKECLTSLVSCCVIACLNFKLSTTLIMLDFILSWPLLFLDYYLSCIILCTYSWKTICPNREGQDSVVGPGYEKKVWYMEKRRFQDGCQLSEMVGYATSSASGWTVCSRLFPIYGFLPVFFTLNDTEKSHVEAKTIHTSKVLPGIICHRHLICILPCGLSRVYIHNIS